MSGILRFVVFAGLIGLVGCGKPPQEASQTPKEAPKNAPVAKAPVQVVPVQRTITVTDEHGIQRQVTVTEDVPIVPGTVAVIPKAEHLRTLPKDGAPANKMPMGERILKRPVEKKTE